MNEVHEITFPVRELKITSNDLSIRMTGQKNSLPTELEESLNNLLTPLLDYNVLAGYCFYDAKLAGSCLYSGDEVLNVGSRVSELLIGVEQIAVFACTVEKELDRIMGEITDPVAIYLADVLGTIFIEKGVEKLKKQFTPVLFNLHTNQTTTLCPGNCGWDIKEQTKLFSLLPEPFLGITLNDYQVMIPVKSINGIVGFGEQVKYRKTSCKTCDSPSCFYRKV